MKKPIKILSVLFGITLFVILSFFGWQLLKWTFSSLTTTLSELVPIDYETQFGNYSALSYLSTQSVANNKDVIKILDKCSDILKTFNTTARNYQFKIYIVEDSIQNAFAMPGGHIIIYRGMLNQMEDESELWGLLSHEAAHVYLQHSLKRIVRESFFSIILLWLFNDIGGLEAFLLNQSKNLISLSYDRDEETSADISGLKSIELNNINPNGIISLFKKLSKHETDLPKFLSTHPDMKERIDIISKQIKPKENYTHLLTPNEWKQLTSSTY